MKKKIIIVLVLAVALVLGGLAMHLVANGFDLQTALQNMHGG